MEVAGQWRRHWAGTAEYGKVTEGGVTTRVARAVEVMQANAPGARVRVMRAAYHQTAGPGAPATSFLMHSSRRVISSGFNMLESPSFPTKPLESPSFPTKPLEISSTPLESSPERSAEDNYEVTEPDDLDISEPSKWRGSTAGSVRLPSEESSSADNASIIDLDSRHKNTLRKYSYDSENSEILFPRRSSRVSPLLESPEDLSTLKYKSLLTGSNDWNNRRKSYSFEDTAPLNETVLHSNDTIAMESSTDSGICKSTELVNDTEDKHYERKERPYDKHEETFKDWLSKNRGTSAFYKNSQKKPYREHDTVVEHPLETNVALKSAGKISITVPIQVDDDYEYKKSNMSDDSDRRAKKVEFCKTELHFAADSGKVNIIATDEKPPPANDFRKRRSAFVPIRGKFEEKPITLFGDTSKDFSGVSNSDFSITNGTSDFDENTAATKSILKNKIPKPKPYLLGENMAFGHNDDNEMTKKSSSELESTVPTAVSLINRQLQAQRRYSDENAGTANADIESPCVKKSAYRTTHKGPSVNDASEKNAACEIADRTDKAVEKPVTKTIKILQMSPVLGRTRTRQLRENELTYFGVHNDTENNKQVKTTKEYRPQIENRYDDEFHSVRLIQKVSNSACNSEADPEEAPEYQNLPLINDFAPVPRVRTKLEYKPQDLRILQPVVESDIDENYTTRRSRHRRHEDSTNVSRSISEPPKARYKIKEKSPRHYDHLRQSELEKRSPTPRFEESQDFDKEVEGNERAKKKTQPRATRRMIEEAEPLYVNLMVQEKLQAPDTKTDSKHRSRQRHKIDVKTENNNNLRKSAIIITDIKPVPVLKDIEKTLVIPAHNDNQLEYRKKVTSDNGGFHESYENVSKKQQLVDKRNRSYRTEKLSTPDYSSDTVEQKTHDSSSRRKLSYDIIDERIPELESKEHRPLKSEGQRSRSSQRKSDVTPEYSSDIADQKTCDSSSRRKLSHDIIECRVPEPKSDEHREYKPKEHRTLKSEGHRSRSSQRKPDVTSEYISNTIKQKTRDSSSQRKLSYDISEDKVSEHKSEAYRQHKPTEHEALKPEEHRSRSSQRKSNVAPEHSIDIAKQKTRDSSSRRKLSYDIIDDQAQELKSEERREHKPKEHRALKSEEHQSNSSQRKSNKSSRGSEERITDVRKPKRIDEKVNSEKASMQRMRNSSKDKTAGRKEPSNKSHHTSDTNSYDSRHNLSTPRIKETGSTEKLLNGLNKTKLNKYVINYDDKNGTVSSVCKVKPNFGADKKKSVTNGFKDKPKDRKIKNKSPDRKVRK